MDIRRHVIVGMASMTMAYGGGVHALGLGEIQLRSALHQPLDASIVLHGTDGLAPSDIAVSLADTSAFSRVGIDRPYFLTLLRFTPVLQGRNLVIQVQSSAPVVEPYLNFLVQLQSPNGTLLREYTLLLDPPLYQSAATVTAIPARPGAQANEALPVSRSVQTAVRPQPELPQLQPQAGASSYQSRSGDNLWAIAKATRADESISVHRQMLAIRALNPDAFVDGDIDRLRAAQQLILPTAEQMGGEATTMSAAAPGPDLSADQAKAITPTEVSQSTEAGGRLRIADQAAPLSAENLELQERLETLESRFSVLLEELNARDRQIASLQAELDVLRQARDAEVDSASLGLVEGSALGSETAGPGSTSADQEPPVAGAVAAEMPELTDSNVESDQPQAFSVMNWWPALLALLAGIAAVIIFRLRREKDDKPQPAVTQPVLVDRAVATKQIDALEGAESYLAYGRYTEARALLEQAIREEPRRLDLRLRQLAVLAQLGDAAGFAVQEAEALQLGGDTAYIEQLKAQFPIDAYQPVIDEQGADPTVSFAAEPLSQPDPASGIEDFQVGLLGQDDFHLDSDWTLLDDLDPSNARRQARAADDQLDELFESNLNDYPEVGELDDDLSEHFSDTPRTPRDS